MGVLGLDRVRRGVDPAGGGAGPVDLADDPELRGGLHGAGLGGGRYPDEHREHERPGGLLLRVAPPEAQGVTDHGVYRLGLRHPGARGAGLQDLAGRIARASPGLRGGRSHVIDQGGPVPKVQILGRHDVAPLPIQVAEAAHRLDDPPVRVTSVVQSVGLPGHAGGGGELAEAGLM